MSEATSELLRAPFTGNLPEPSRTLRELQLLAGRSDSGAARLLAISPQTFRRWRSDRPPNPTAIRLLAIHAGHVPWPGWHGWEVHGGLLFPPGSARGLAPAQVEAVPWLMALVHANRTRREPGADSAGSRRNATLANHDAGAPSSRPLAPSNS